MQERVYFISDVHLPLVDNERSQKQISNLHSFLDEVSSRKGCLYIVGDLFDFWFEYHSVIARQYFFTLKKLSDLIGNGSEVHYICGNHDFWLNDFLSQDLGIKVYHHPVEINLQGLDLLITHGDGLLRRDKGYRLLKKILRNRFNIFLFRLIHPDLGYWLARKISQGSRKLGMKNKEKVAEIRAEITAWAYSQLEQGRDGIIMGHYHQVFHEKFEKKHFICLGDWIRHFTFGHLHQGQLSLNYWNSDKPFSER